MNRSEWKITQKVLEDTLLKPNKYSKHGLLLEQNEFGGIIEFKDNNCRIVDGETVCDKLYTNHSVKKGSSSSVSTPLGRVNFHTHPLHFYISGNVIWGWPSGEDMGQCINFARDGTLVHIVFTLEGAYIIKVNKIISPRDTRILEDVFKSTHEFRSKNQATQLKNFRERFQVSGKTTKDMWLKVANGISLNKLYTLYNLINDKNLKVPDNNDSIYEVSLANIGKTLTFNANYISESCHLKSFGKSSDLL